MANFKNGPEGYSKEELKEINAQIKQQKLEESMARSLKNNKERMAMDFMKHTSQVKTKNIFEKNKTPYKK